MGMRLRSARMDVLGSIGVAVLVIGMRMRLVTTWVRVGRTIGVGMLRPSFLLGFLGHVASRARVQDPQDAPELGAAGIMPCKV